MRILYTKGTTVLDYLLAVLFFTQIFVASKFLTVIQAENICLVFCCFLITKVYFCIDINCLFAWEIFYFDQVLGSLGLSALTEHSYSL